MTKLSKRMKAVAEKVNSENQYDVIEAFELLKSLSNVKFNEGVDVIKIDVEGYGYEVLQGSCEYLKDNSPVLQVEVLSKKINFSNKEKEILDYLNSINYKLINRKQHYTTHLFSDIRCVDYLFEKSLK